jgi:toluene-4-monooxygenase system protein B
MLVPLYGFLQGDSMGLLVLVHDEDRVQDVGDALQRAAAVRIAPRACVRVMHAGRHLRADLTVAQAGLGPLDRVDVVAEDEP